MPRSPSRPTRQEKPRAKASPGLGLWWRLLLMAILLALLYWYAGQVDALARSLYSFFGGGGILLIVGLGVLLWVLSKKGVRTWLIQLLSYLRWWRWELAGVAFFLAAFGLLAFFDQGGNFGRAIIREKNIVGGLRLLGLVVIGFLFVAPRSTTRLIYGVVSVLLRSLWHFLVTFFTGLVALNRRRQVSQPPQPKPVPAAVPSTAMLGEEKPPPAKATPATGLPPLIKGLWRKAGTKERDTEKEKEADKEPQPVITASGWQLPPITILDLAPEAELRPVDNEKRARLIEEALASYGVDARVMQINPGPTVTQFGVEPGWDRKIREIRERDKNGTIKVRQEEVSRTRVKVERISSLANDLALALAAPSIRIEAPVPGKPLVGIEVPNVTAGVVGLRGVLESAAFHKLRAKSRLAIALGKGAGGEAVVGDLAKMPHLLVAGATGSGKTVFLNSVVCSFMLYNTPDDLRFVMIDPKRVELVSYNPIPQMVTPVIVETERAVETLRWLNKEMDNRYRRFAAVGSRNLEDYNKSHHPPFPHLILVVDELADLMMAAFDEVEHSLCRLAQMSRATGIHLVVATQRPSVDVVTGLIKANFPTRISFAVTSQVDSRTILDSVGAEKLLGRGDMLYLPTDAAKPKRMQGCYVSDAEIERLVSFWGRQRKAEAIPVIAGEAGPEADPLLEAARKLVVEHKQVSASFLQRRLQIGYSRAARLLEMLEQEKGGGQGARPATGV